jgi:hypothetical protein
VVEKAMNYLTAWRKGDLVRLPNGEEFRLTSDGYEIQPPDGDGVEYRLTYDGYLVKTGRIYCDTDRGRPISYLKLIKKARLLEDGNGRKNEPQK